MLCNTSRIYLIYKEDLQKSSDAKSAKMSITMYYWSFLAYYSPIRNLFFLYLCQQKLRKECNLLEMSVG